MQRNIKGYVNGCRFYHWLGLASTVAIAFMQLPRATGVLRVWALNPKPP